MKKNLRKVVNCVLGVLMLLLLSLLSACQSDFTAPSASFKILYPGENNKQEHLSRDAGMSSQTGYRSALSWGNFGKDN